MNVHGTTSNGKSFPPPRFTIQENGILTPSYTHIAEEEEEEEERTVITGFPIYFSIRCALGGSLKGGESPLFGSYPNTLYSEEERTSFSSSSWVLQRPPSSSRDCLPMAAEKSSSGLAGWYKE